MHCLANYKSHCSNKYLFRLHWVWCLRSPAGVSLNSSKTGLSFSCKTPYLGIMDKNKGKNKFQQTSLMPSGPLFTWQRSARRKVLRAGLLWKKVRSSGSFSCLNPNMVVKDTSTFSTWRPCHSPPRKFGKDTQGDTTTSKPTKIYPRNICSKVVYTRKHTQTHTDTWTLGFMQNLPKMFFKTGKLGMS